MTLPTACVALGSVLRVTSALVPVKSAPLRTPPRTAAQLRILEQAREALVTWRARRPASDSSERGVAIDERLKELEALIDQPVEHRTEARKPAAIRLEPSAPPPFLRPLDVALLSIGAVSTVAGAAVLGEGVAFTKVSRARAAAANTSANALEQQHGSGFDEASYDRSLYERRYRPPSSSI